MDKLQVGDRVRSGNGLTGTVVGFGESLYEGTVTVEFGPDMGVYQGVGHIYPEGLIRIEETNDR